jgi:hypothetical protein
MSEAFSSICGKTSSISESAVKRSALEHDMDAAPAGRPELTAGPASDVPEQDTGRLAQAAFASLVTVKSCANANKAALLEGYLTFARQGAYLRSYMY